MKFVTIEPEKGKWFHRQSVRSIFDYDIDEELKKSIRRRYFQRTNFDAFLEELEVLKDKVAALEIESKSHVVFEFRDIKKDQAKVELVSFMKDQKSKGTTSSSVFELSQKLRLPANQVEEILEELQSEKKVILS